MYGNIKYLEFLTKSQKTLSLMMMEEIHTRCPRQNSLSWRAVLDKANTGLLFWGTLFIIMFKFGQFAQRRLSGTCCDDRVIPVFVNCPIVVH